MKVETRQYTINDQTAVRLAEIYIEKTEYACAVAKVCDNILDRSGGLLGIVRERAQELKSAKLRANNSRVMPCAHWIPGGICNVFVDYRCSKDKSCIISARA